jgi:hypothetical protein
MRRSVASLSQGVLNEYAHVASGYFEYISAKDNYSH